MPASAPYQPPVLPAQQSYTHMPLSVQGPNGTMANGSSGAPSPIPASLPNVTTGYMANGASHGAQPHHQVQYSHQNGFTPGYVAPASHTTVAPPVSSHAQTINAMVSQQNPSVSFMNAMPSSIGTMYHHGANVVAASQHQGQNQFHVGQVVPPGSQQHVPSSKMVPNMANALPQGNMSHQFAQSHSLTNQVQQPYSTSAVLPPSQQSGGLSQFSPSHSSAPPTSFQQPYSIASSYGNTYIGEVQASQKQSQPQSQLQTISPPIQNNYNSAGGFASAGVTAQYQPTPYNINSSLAQPQYQKSMTQQVVVQPSIHNNVVRPNVPNMAVPVSSHMGAVPQGAQNQMAYRPQQQVNIQYQQPYMGGYVPVGGQMQQQVFSGIDTPVEGAGMALPAPLQPQKAEQVKTKEMTQTEKELADVFG